MSAKGFSGRGLGVSIELPYSGGGRKRSLLAMGSFLERLEDYLETVTGLMSHGISDVLHDCAMAKAFRADPAYAEALLAVVVEEGNAEELRILLRQFALASGTPRPKTQCEESE